MAGLGMPEYQRRIADAELRRALAASGAVVIEGPKACGKTETGLQVAQSVVRLDIDPEARQAALVAPGLLLEGGRPRLIDEWQIEPAIWDHVRRAVDAEGRPGLFVLTGSATPTEDASRHTGVGRFSFVRMRPMSLFESGHATGAVSLAGLFDGAPVAVADPGVTIADLAERIVVGGWPAYQARPVTDAAKGVVDHLRQIRRVDVRQASGARYVAEAKLEAFMRAYARSIATETPNTVLARDAGGAEGPLSTNTVAEYLDALGRLYLVEEQPAWAPHLRAKARVRGASKRHFVDPSLAAAALGAGPAKLLRDLNLLGLLFESLVVRDLRVLSSPLDGKVLHYRDSSDVEADAIIELADGRWGAVEVKLGAGRVEEGAVPLLKFASQVDTTKCGAPAFLVVLSATGYGYTRPDGVHVVPVGVLGP